jgi:AcrR family transcriptional regulator
MATNVIGISGKKRMSAEDRRSQIVSVAAQLFSRNGFNGTTTRQIAEQVGVSEAIIFRHFQTKQDLYSAIIDYKSGECLKQLWLSSEDAMGRKDDRTVFMALATEILEMHRKDPTLLRLLYYSALEGHELSKMFFDTTAKLAYERTAVYIAQRIQDRVFRDLDPVAAARTFFSLVAHRAVVRELFHDGQWQKSTSREAAAEIMEIFLYGLIANSSSTNR